MIFFFQYFFFFHFTPEFAECVEAVFVVTIQLEIAGMDQSGMSESDFSLPTFKCTVYIYNRKWENVSQPHPP